MPTRVPRAGAAADHGRPRHAHGRGPGDAGDAAPAPARPGAGPPGRQGHRGAGGAHPGRSTHRGDAPVLALHAGVLDPPDTVRPRALLSGASRGQVAPVRVGAVRRWGTQVPGHDLRGPGDQARDQRTPAALRVVRPPGPPSGLRSATGPGTAHHGRERGAWGRGRGARFGGGRRLALELVRAWNAWWNAAGHPRSERCVEAHFSRALTTFRSPSECETRIRFLSSLPTEVLGISSTKAKRSGTCHLAIRCSRCARRSATSGSGWPSLIPIVASGRSSHLGSGTPITATSATAGCSSRWFSTSTDEIHSPPDLMTSLARSVSCRNPSGLMYPTSPVRSQPSSKESELSTP